MKVAILLGSTRTARQSHKVGFFLGRELTARSVDVDIIDLAETPLPVFGEDNPSPAITDRIATISKTLQMADALIFVTPEYQGSFSGALKNAIDFFGNEFTKKPIGVAAASAGRMGGINASVQLQHVILSLGAYPLPLKFLVPEVQNAFDDSYNPVNDAVTRSASRFLTELLWFAEAISSKKGAQLPAKKVDVALVATEPIGAVVKEANDVFTKVVRRTSRGDLDRTDWQLLNFLYREANALDKNRVFDHLSFFESNEGIEAKLRRFETAGLVTASNGKVVTTSEGKAMFDEALTIQERIMKKSIQDVSESDYKITISTIKRIVSNLREFLPEKIRMAKERL